MQGCGKRIAVRHCFSFYIFIWAGQRWEKIKKIYVDISDKKNEKLITGKYRKIKN